MFKFSANIPDDALEGSTQKHELNASSAAQTSFYS